MTALKHIKNWVKSRGITVEYVPGNRSHFEHDTPHTIYIARRSEHQTPVSILHEYYHTRQLEKRDVSCKHRYDRTVTEYKAELFAIRCLRKSGVKYDSTYIEENWGSKPRDSRYGYYALAFNLLKENGFV